MAMSVENKARLAFAITVLLALTATGIWYASTSGRYATYQIRTLDSVSGLMAGAPVEFRGVEVGKVKRVELVDRDSVSILIDVAKRTPVTAATVAGITARGLASRGFMGYVCISLHDVGSDFRPLQTAAGSEYPIIRAEPSTSVNLDMTIGQLNRNVEYLTERLQSVLDDNTLASLRQSVGNLQQVTRMLAANNRRLDSLIMHSEAASREVGPLLQSSKDTVSAMQHQFLPEAYRTLSTLEELSKSLGGVASKIDRDPSVLIRGSPRPSPGPGEAR